ncbi:MAG: hypothetical protein R3204_05515 [Oceanospirillum sp.]|nr:hypothetical protein [Oceanospirillum sp.]
MPLLDNIFNNKGLWFLVRLELVSGVSYESLSTDIENRAGALSASCDTKQSSDTNESRDAKLGRGTRERFFKSRKEKNGSDEGS